jgi:glycosyltransferase involved in cell wall biosynthesis
MVQIRYDKSSLEKIEKGSALSVPLVTCIIPFWNEGRNLFCVLDEISKVGDIDEIICVDDASQDRNYMKVQSYYPHVKIIRLEKNKGKSGAIREGLKQAQGDYVFLIDADLRNLDHRELEKALDAFRKAGDIDMLILRRVNAVFFVKLYRADVLFTGERILKKSDLETILNGSVNGWQLESAINTWMYLNGKNVSWIPHSGINKHKYLKWGILDGLKLDMKTCGDMITAAGFNNIIKQILFFARNELRLGDNEI